MARLSKRLEKELETMRARLDSLKAKHEQERQAMDQAEAHAASRVAFLEKSLADALEFEAEQ